MVGAMTLSCSRLARGLLVGLVLCSSTAHAHDSWMRVKSVERGKVALAFDTGEIFPFSENATKPARVASWVAYDDRGVRFSAGKPEIEELELVARVNTPRALRVAAVALNAHFIEMEAGEFEKYLEEEHALEALAWRKEKGESAAKGRELYTKHAKAIIPGSSGKGAARAVGHALELVPVDDLLAPVEQGEIAVRLLYRGTAVPKARVSLGREGLGAHGYVAHVETDAEGIARFRLEMPGLHFLRAQVMKRRDPAKKDAEWESFWASLTFVVAPDPRIEAIAQAVQEVHGAAGPWAVFGHRAATRALAALELQRGSFDLVVEHFSPREVQYSCIADGVQAASGASLGKLNLTLADAKLADLRTTFLKKSTGQKITITPSEKFRKEMLGVDRAHLLAAGRKAAAMADDELMKVD